MFGIGGFELFLIVLFGFLIFGPDKLPVIAKTVGTWIAKFRNAQEDIKDTFGPQAFMSNDPESPLRNPVEVLEEAAAKRETKTKAKEDAETAKSTFAERKAAYERERAEKAKHTNTNANENASASEGGEQ